MPIPNQYVSQTALKDGAPVTVRPIRPEDEPLMVKFYESLSERSVYMRYLRILDLDRQTARERLARICSMDYHRGMVLVAERANPETTGEPKILGVGRLRKNRSAPDEAEVALIVSDRFQGQGLGTMLLEKLLEIGRAEGLRRITADILRKNRATQRLLEKLGFDLRRDKGEGVVKADLDLHEAVEQLA